MALPDVVVNIASASGSRTLPSGTGVAFAAGVTERGPSDKPVALKSLDDFVAAFGARLVASTLSDWVETFFGEGGADLWVGRVFGAGAAQASHNLADAGAGVSLVVKAGYLGSPDPGTWGNSLKVEVVAVTGGFQINVYRTISAVDVLVESSFTLVTQADAIGWAKAYSKYVVISLGATALVPAAAAAASLAGGTDGAGVADADYALGLALFSPELGSGQVCAPGRTTSTGKLQVIAHAVANRRFALLDSPDTPTAATVIADAQALYTAPNSGRRWAQPAWPWDVIPGLTSLTTRTVPPTARLAAQYARVDAEGNPNQAAAGRYGVARYVIDLSQPSPTDADRKALNEAGVTVSRRRFGGTIMTFGARTLADQVNDAQWSMAPNVRCTMAYAAKAAALGDGQEFDQVDAQGHALSKLKGGLTDAAQDLFREGALFGKTPQEAFLVNTSDALNPVANLAAGKMKARVSLRTSPFAEVVTIDVVKVPITQDLA